MGNYTTYGLFGWQSSLILWLQQKPWLCLQNSNASQEHPGLALHSVRFFSKTEDPTVAPRDSYSTAWGPTKTQVWYIQLFFAQILQYTLVAFSYCSCRGQLLSSGTRFSCFPTKYGCFRALRKRGSANLTVHKNNIVFWICMLPCKTTRFCIKDCLTHTAEERSKGGSKIYL